MATWGVYKPAPPNSKALWELTDFLFHANNSMEALIKFRRWCRKNNKVYGVDREIRIYDREDIEDHRLHNEYIN